MRIKYDRELLVTLVPQDVTIVQKVSQLELKQLLNYHYLAF